LEAGKEAFPKIPSQTEEILLKDTPILSDTSCWAGGCGTLWETHTGRFAPKHRVCSMRVETDGRGSVRPHLGKRAAWGSAVPLQAGIASPARGEWGCGWHAEVRRSLDVRVCLGAWEPPLQAVLPPFVPRLSRFPGEEAVSRPPASR